MYNFCFRKTTLKDLVKASYRMWTHSSSQRNCHRTNPEPIIHRGPEFGAPNVFN